MYAVTAPVAEPMCRALGTDETGRLVVDAVVLYEVTAVMAVDDAVPSVV